jgi:poly-gamma-glutamate synthesis protein (capsule biosynthesis protein)
MSNHAEQLPTETATQEVARIFPCGDVMTGRGVDQILPHPCDPLIHESYVKSARDYVRLAEEANGRIPRAAKFSYIWGAALQELNRAQPDVRIINLETSITAGAHSCRKASITE